MTERNGMPELRARLGWATIGHTRFVLYTGLHLTLETAGGDREKIIRAYGEHTGTHNPTYSTVWAVVSNLLQLEWHTRMRQRGRLPTEGNRRDLEVMTREALRRIV